MMEDEAGFAILNGVAQEALSNEMTFGSEMKTLRECRHLREKMFQIKADEMHSPLIQEGSGTSGNRKKKKSLWLDSSMWQAG